MLVRKRSSRSLLVIALVSVVALVMAGCGDDNASGADATDSTNSTEDGEAGDDKAEWPDKLTFAAVPAEADDKLEESYRITVEILSKELGVDIELFQAADYAGVIEAMIADKVDMAQFGPFSYVIAVANGPDITPVGALVDEAEEEPGYQSYGITKADNDAIESLEDFEGKKVCFVDPSSTSGFLYPSAGLLDLDIDPEKDVEPIFAGGHDSSAISVKNGDCEAGFAFDKMVDERLIESGDLAEGDLKVVWKSEVIAGSPFTFRNKLPESLQAEISTTILEKVNIDWAVENDFCDSAEDCPLNDEGTWGYKTVDDEFYEGVREVCRITKSAQCEGVS